MATFYPLNWKRYMYCIYTNFLYPFFPLFFLLGCIVHRHTLKRQRHTLATLLQNTSCTYKTHRHSIINLCGDPIYVSCLTRVKIILSDTQSVALYSTKSFYTTTPRDVYSVVQVYIGTSIATLERANISSSCAAYTHIPSVRALRLHIIMYKISIVKFDHNIPQVEIWRESVERIRKAVQYMMMCLRM